MSRYCNHGYVMGRCPREDAMDYVPPEQPFRINVDKRGMPLDYATYVWLLYGKRVDDRSPARIAFLGNTGFPNRRLILDV